MPWFINYSAITISLGDRKLQSGIAPLYISYRKRDDSGRSLLIVSYAHAAFNLRFFSVFQTRNTVILLLPSSVSLNGMLRR